jgi:CubicO group peptidase (beta-lactamase class C family)
VAGLPAPHGWSYSNVGYLLARRRIEAAAGAPLSEVLRDAVIRPAGLRGVRLASGVQDLPHLPGAAGYDFDWVYHGCLLGPPAQAAAMMAAILDGTLLSARALAALRRVTPLGGAVARRPWSRHGYGTGLMAGEMRGLPAEGHSGAGPFSTCAVYRIGGRVAAAFSTAPTEAAAERAALRASRAPSGRGHGAAAAPRSARNGA